MPQSKMRYRSLNIRSSVINEENDEIVFEGYFTTFGDKYSIGMNYWTGDEEFEIIDSEALRNADFSECFFKYNHDDSHLVMASYDSGTIQVEYDDTGAKCIIRCPRTRQAEDVHKLVSKGILQKMSWAFTINKESFDKRMHTYTVEEVNKVYDISVVPLPANPNTEISARGRDNSNSLDLAKRRLALKIKISENL